jgi:hypothetical protein
MADENANTDCSKSNQLKAADQRKKLYIYPEVQKSMLFYATLSSLVAITAASAIGLVAHNGINEIIMQTQDAQPSMSVLSELHQIQMRVSILYGTVAFLVITVTFYTGLYLSHRIVGPISRIEKNINEGIQTGHFEKITLRKNDFFKGFADKVNLLFQKLSKPNNN